jgi:hypothetical protein
MLLFSPVSGRRPYYWAFPNGATSHWSRVSRTEPGILTGWRTFGDFWRGLLQGRRSSLLGRVGAFLLGSASFAPRERHLAGPSS